MRTFRQAVQSGAFTVTGELDLNRLSAAADVARQARQLGPYVDAVQVTDNPGGRVQMASLAAAGIALQCGVDVVPHLSTRDRNRIALEGDLLGMGAMGVSSVLLLRGDELPASVRPPAPQIWELSGRDLIALARALAEDEAVETVPELCIGAVATVFNPKKSWTPQALLDKVASGAEFIQTQPCFDIPALKRYMGRLIDSQMTWRTAIIVSLAVLPSAVSAKWLRHHLKGSLLPREIVRRLEQARDPESEGVAICAELLQQFQEVPGVTGAHLMAPGEPETMTAAIEASGLRRGPAPRAARSRK